MFFAFFLMAGMLAALARGGTLRSLSQLPLRFGWLVVLALVAKIAIFSSPFAASSLAGLAPLVYILVNLLLVLGVALNWTLPGMKLLALGLFLNFAAIAANGGYMPVSASALDAAGYHEGAMRLETEGRLTTVVLMTERTALPWLGDRFALPPPIPFRGAISVGDVLVGLGAFWLVFKGMVGRPGKMLARQMPRPDP